MIVQTGKRLGQDCDCARIVEDNFFEQDNAVFSVTEDKVQEIDSHRHKREKLSIRDFESYQ